MNASNTNMTSMHHPWRWNVTTSIMSMIGLKNGHICKNLTTKSWTPEISWECRRKRKVKTSNVLRFLFQFNPLHREVNITAQGPHMILTPEPGIANEKKRRTFLWGCRKSRLKYVQLKAFWRQTLKKSSTLKFIMNISFILSIVQLSENIFT